MSKAKERREEKQREREAKLLARIKSGEAVRVCFEERKAKKAQPNTKSTCKTEEEELESKRERKPRTYLETLDLSQLQLIAIMVGPKGRYAMVREAKGLGHVIQKGTAIGRSGGVVESITETTVTIREEYRDFRGQKKFREVKKTLDTGK